MFGLERSAFWQWWTGELANLFPSPDRRVLANRKTRTEVSLGPQDVRVYRSQSLREPLDDNKCKARAATLDEFASSRAGRGKALLSFDESLCFSRQVVLPAAALRRAGEILDLELERIVPFGRTEIVSGWFPLGPSSGGQQKVSHVILKKQDVALAVNAVAAAGMQVQGVAIRPPDGAAMPVVFQTDGQLFGARSSRRWSRIAGAAAMACVLSGIAVAGLLLWRQQRSIAEYETGITALEKPAVEVRKAIDGLALNSNRSQALIRLRYSQANLVTLWAELTRLIPDQAWVQNLSLKEKSLQIDGIANDAEVLIKTLEASPNLKNVKFAAPVFRDPGVSGSRFSIVLELEQNLP